MKAAVITSPNRIEIQEIDPPEIKANELLVKIKNCGICTLEQRLYTGEMKIYYPIIPGHEASGEVAEVGKDVISGIKPGTRVALDLVIRCGECYYCRTGHSNMCLNRFNRGNRVLGGFGEYIAVKPAQVFSIPDSISFQEAAFAEPVACCIRSLKKINLHLAEDLLIMGAGSMGQMHLQAALCMGARVFVSDPDGRRRTMAEKLGAFLTIDPAREDLEKIIKHHTDGRGVDACIITSPAHVALNSAFNVISKTGRINIYTSYHDKPAIPTDANTIHRTEQVVTGSEGRTEFDFFQAVRLIVFGKVDVKPLISAITTYAQIEAGMQAAMSKDTYRVLLDNKAG
ncbi:MAG: alcohol dehydrogenase catalytic domain-containing protein [Spirochaetota bacterium]